MRALLAVALVAEESSRCIEEKHVDLPRILTCAIQKEAWIQKELASRPYHPTRLCTRDPKGPITEVSALDHRGDVTDEEWQTDSTVTCGGLPMLR